MVRSESPQFRGHTCACDMDGCARRQSLAVASLHSQRGRRGQILTLGRDRPPPPRLEQSGQPDARRRRLRVNLDRDDADAGRHIEQMTQYCKGARVGRRRGPAAEQRHRRLGLRFRMRGIGLDVTPAMAATPRAMPPRRTRARAGSGPAHCSQTAARSPRVDGDQPQRHPLLHRCQQRAVIRRYGVLQRRPPTPRAPFHGALGTKKVSATPVTATVIASDPVRPPASVT